MKNSTKLVALLFGISAILAGVSPMTSNLSEQSFSTRAKTTTELEVENKIRLAKVELHEAAFDYLLSIRRMKNKLVTIEVEFKVGLSHECVMAKLANSPCPPPQEMNYPAYIGEIKKSARRLILAKSNFISQIKTLRYDTCKNLGVACKWKENSPDIIADLPYTILDSEIDQALTMLPTTENIVRNIIFNHQTNIRNISNT
ncbi:MAG: hypothetical protein H6969_06755 [Gammaproteobacteria bacterium]|nr:hypothetical protein [Gammaproteobacteria bacterium]